MEIGGEKKRMSGRTGVSSGVAHDDLVGGCGTVSKKWVRTYVGKCGQMKNVSISSRIRCHTPGNSLVGDLP